MPYRLLFQNLPETQLRDLTHRNPKKDKRVLKCLGLLEVDPRYPGLHSHRYEDFDDVHRQKIWESYVENKTPGAFRIFWHYGPDEGEITIVAIAPQP